MTWVKGSDTAANHPIPLAVLAHPKADDRLLNEVFGFVWRCALQSGCYTTDYVVERGTAIQMAGGIERANFLLEVAEFAGYIERIQINEREAYKLVQDKDLFHIRLREEVEWEAQRRRDNANPALIVPVRVRDGDACRYCGIVVSWTNDRKSARAGTYDHRVPGEGATIETMVVACKGCNETRGSNPDAIRLLPEPSDPYYAPSTYTWLEANRWAITNGYVPTRVNRKKVVRPGDIAPGLQIQAPAVQRTRTQRESAPRTDSQSENAGQTTQSGRPTAAPARPASSMSATNDPEEAPDPAHQRSRTQQENAPRNDTQSPRDQRPGTQPGNAQPNGRPDLRISADPPENGSTSNDARSADPAERQGAGSGSTVGTGRAGPGRDGTGTRSTPTPPQPASSSGARARRRRRSSRRPT